MSTRGAAGGWSAVWSSTDPADPSSRLEVGVFRSWSGGQATVYLSKYRGNEVGTHSVGMGLSAAEEVADALREAVLRARHSIQGTYARSDRETSQSR